MKSYVIYASRSGNTLRIAEAVGAILGTSGEVEVVSVDEGPTSFPLGTDLVVLGAPTEAHGVTKPMVEYLGRLDADALANAAVAVFDTRVTWPRLLSGSAAAGIAERIATRHGVKPVVPPQSFFVDTKPELKGGEVDRATAWARTLLAEVEVDRSSLSAIR